MYGHIVQYTAKPKRKDTWSLTSGALPREQAGSYHTGADFWSRDRFILLKTVEDSKDILFLWVISINIEKLKPINALNIF